MNKIVVKGNKLFLENGQMIYLTKDMINKYSLRQKEYLEKKELALLILDRIRLSAYNMLARRDYFIKEFRQKLIEKHNFPKIVDLVVNEFINRNHLNDYEKAHSYVREHSSYGPKKLAQIFFQMEIEKDIIDEVLKIDEDEQIEKIKNLLLKLGQKENEKKIVSLMRRGFLYRDIKKAIDILEEEK